MTTDQLKDLLETFQNKFHIYFDTVLYWLTNYTALSLIICGLIVGIFMLKAKPAKGKK